MRRLRHCWRRSGTPTPRCARRRRRRWRGWGRGPPGDVPALRAALKEKAAPPELRARAAPLPGGAGAGARDAVPDLGEALRDSDVNVRRAAAAALAQVGPGAKGAILAAERGTGGQGQGGAPRRPGDNRQAGCRRQVGLGRGGRPGRRRRPGHPQGGGTDAGADRPRRGAGRLRAGTIQCRRRRAPRSRRGPGRDGSRRQAAHRRPDRSA